MQLIARRHGLAKDHIRALEQAFRQEDSQQGVKEAISELAGPSLIQPKDYSAGRKSSYREARKDRTANFIAAYMENNRAKRYTHKASTRFANPDGDVYETSDDSNENSAQV